MLYFYSTEQDVSNASYYKGKLFEQLLSEYLKAAAYSVELRAKRASLEYDIVGSHDVDGREVIGEAKAHSSTIGGQDVAAFVGKAIPFFHGAKPCSALFLSVSALSPEADDYLLNLKKSTPYQIATKCGAELEQHIRELLKLPSAEQVTALTRAIIPVETAQHLLHTNRGTFVVVTGCSQEAAFDDRFALISTGRTIVSDAALLELVNENVQAFQELKAVGVSSADTIAPHQIPRRAIPDGLITSADWLDYRRPSGPAFFVGRAEALKKANDLTLTDNGGAIVEIKSRSGVGKSSLLAVLASEWQQQGHRVELHDVRDVQSSEDVLRLVQRFVGDVLAIRAFEDIPPALRELTTSLNGKRAFFIVDQFESTFQIPEVFTAYEYLALCVSRSSIPCAMIFSRKDDLLTTHDDILVSFDRIRGLAQPITLDDFSISEATLLIQKAAANYSNRLSSKVFEQVLEFAQGFPWLLKRTMAHVVSIVSKGTSQQELLSSGLHLEDLFEEELAELDEQERGYLTRIAGVLPATYHALARRFEDDPFLRQMLEKLTYRKLLRLSAGTYDTYNDVFKDFLLYERMPERSHSQIIRMGVVPVMQAFRSLGGATKLDPIEMSARLAKSSSGVYNILRDLRLAGLVSKTTDGWEVPAVVRQFEHQGRLGEFVRQSILRNRTVSDLVIEIEKTGGMRKADLSSWLQSHFPFMSAKPAVWVQYSGMLIDWLTRLRLAEIDADEVIKPCHGEKEALIKELGNLEFAGRGYRPKSAAFVPSAPWTTVSRVWAEVNSTAFDASKCTRAEVIALSDLRKLGAITNGKSDKLALRWGFSELNDNVKIMLQDEAYTVFWDLAKSGTNLEKAVAEAFELNDLAPTTREWLGKRLATWGRAFGHLKSGKLKQGI
jgi:hypothetical protein